MALRYVGVNSTDEDSVISLNRTTRWRVLGYEDGTSAAWMFSTDRLKVEGSNDGIVKRLNA
jgi:hypothetical protein